MADTTHPVAEKKDSPSITVTLDPQFHAYVLKAAKEDDRSPAKWLKRYVQENLVEVMPKTASGHVANLDKVYGPAPGFTNMPGLDTVYSPAPGARQSEGMMPVGGRHSATTSNEL